MGWVGLGVFKVEEGLEVVESVKTAIKHGYRSIDTAAIYGNETGVGQGIKESGISREELFITTKVWNSEQGYETTLKAFDDSLNRLGLNYIDLYLIHWPGPSSEQYIETWKALEKLYKDGRARAIGVCNFHVHHLETLIEQAEIIPMVNQVEYHPHLSQTELLSYCQSKGIQLEAWSPLKQGELIDEPAISQIAAKYNKSTAQVILRWDLQNKVVTIPKSIREERIIENASIFDFELSAEDMAILNGLNKNVRTGPNPDLFTRGFED